MEYIGDTWQKKAARITMWWDLVERFSGVGDGVFASLRFLVLCSRAAGDVSVLAGLGVPMDNIWAIDVDAVAVDAAKERFPGVHGIACDVRHAAAILPSDFFDVVHLDWCGNVSPRLLRTTASVLMRCGSRASVVGVVVKRGRETRQQMAALRAHRTASKRRASAIGQTMPEFRGRDRATLICNRLEQMCGGAMWVRPMHVITYQSSRPGSAGSPMLVVTSAMFPREPGERVKRYSPVLTNDFTGHDDESLKLRMLMSAEMYGAEMASLMWNIPKTSVAAFRAVATRCGKADAVRENVVAFRRGRSDLAASRAAMWDATDLDVAALNALDEAKKPGGCVSWN